MSEQRRVAKRTQRVKPKPVVEAGPALDAGDAVEFSLTAEIKTQAGRVMWAKAGASSTVRPDETPEEAYDRVQGLVAGFVEQTAKDLA